MSVARHNLLQDKLRFGLSVIAISLAITVVLVLDGIAAGVVTQTGAYLTHAPGELVVAPPGSNNFLLTTTSLPPGTEAATAAMPGVAEVVPLLSKLVVVQLHGQRQASFLIGYDPERGGGPWRMVAGRAPASDDEAVLGRVLAERHGVGVGDAIDILGRTFTISGLSGETTPLLISFLFIRKSALEALALAPGATSLLLVEPAAGVSLDTVRAQLESLSGTQVLLKQELIDNDVDVFVGSFLPVLRLMAGIAFVVGTLVVGLVIHAATTERQREYGVLKAIGIRNLLLYRLVAAQALIAAAAGVVGGLVLGLIASRLIMAVRPEYLISLTPRTIVVAALAGLGMALAAALVPARLIAGLAPADVMRR